MDSGSIPLSPVQHDNMTFHLMEEHINKCMIGLSQISAAKAAAKHDSLCAALQFTRIVAEGQC